MEFKVGDVFQICDDGFDYEKKIYKSETIYHSIKSSFFKPNHLKYLEVVDKMKHGKKTKLKIKLFHQNKKVLNEQWTMSSFKERKEPEELYKWIYPNILKRKLEIGSISPSSWGDIAKEALLEVEDESSFSGNSYQEEVI